MFQLSLAYMHYSHAEQYSAVFCIIFASSLITAGEQIDDVQ